ncbi:DUF3618 domain-containing protein [Sphaerimonospora mesophila]|uniref:DUF3618 domain-containing protein n=1 Tax=Sphaerimonospora mesophila TaxID=37483 RepID=UPI0006E1C4A3
MTETDPGSARPTAGRMGVHRQDVAEPVTESESLNTVPQRRTTPPAEEHGQGKDDVAKVRQDIERTRDDLGDTIEALAAKADIRGRAQERMHATASLAREKAAGVADRVRSATPEPIRGAAGKVTEQARRRPRAAAAGAGTLAAGAVIMRIITRMTRNRRTTPRLAVKGMRGVRGVRRVSGLRRISGMRGAPRIRGISGLTGMRGLRGIGRTPMRRSMRRSMQRSMSGAGMARMRRMARMARMTRATRRGRRGLARLFT